jgi:hypothetical protein
MRSRISNSAAFAAIGGSLLLFGLLSLRLIPFHEPFWGLDFQNIYAFETCPEALKAGIYSVSGKVCGDATGRPFIYPPAMFQSFAWVRWFTFSQALTIWDATMVAIMVGVGSTWLWLDRQAHSGWRTVVLAVFWLGLMVQYPFVFALERSNNDVIPIALWTVAAVMFVGRRYALSGGFAGLAIALKVYPLVATAIVVIGMARSSRARLALLGTGVLAGALLASVLWWHDTVHYVAVVLPEFAALTPRLTVFSHPIRSLPLPPVITMGIAVVLFGSWALASWRTLPQAPLIVFAGALAISTYFSSTSWDYNLITVYPLLLLTATRALGPASSGAWKVASVISIFALATGRGAIPPAALVLLQIVILVGIAWLVILDDRVGGTPDEDQSLSGTSPRDQQFDQDASSTP